MQDSVVEHVLLGFVHLFLWDQLFLNVLAWKGPPKASTAKEEKMDVEDLLALSKENGEGRIKRCNNVAIWVHVRYG